MDNTDAGAQFAAQQQPQAGIIAGLQKEIDRLNVLAIDNAAEIKRLKETVEWYRGKYVNKAGAQIKADIAAGAHAPAPSEQAEPRLAKLPRYAEVHKGGGKFELEHVPFGTPSALLYVADVERLFAADRAAAAPAAPGQALAEIVGEIHRSADKGEAYCDFTVTISHKQYLALCSEEGNPK